MKKGTKALIASAAVLAAASAAVSAYFCDYALSKNGGMKLRSGVKKGDHIDAIHKENMELLEARNKKYKEWFTGVADSVHLLTNSGVKVHALTAAPDTYSRKYAILCHGYKDTAASMGYAAYRFTSMGYNVIAPDGRAAGRTEGRYIGMGYLESMDVKGFVNFILAKDPQAEIVLYGISMGAAEVMMAAGRHLPDNVKAIIEDSGYTSVWDEFALQLKNIFKLPTFPILYMVSEYSKIRVGYSFKEASAVNALKNSTIPILFIHGTADKLVPFTMVEQLYDAAAGEKEKLIVDDSEHMQSDLLNPEQYWDRIRKFLQKYVIG